MKKIFLVGLFLSAVPFAAALSVATYNVENYLVADRMVENVFRQAYPKPESEKKALRRVIAGMAVDVLALQEMGKQPFLDELQRDLKADGQDYPYATVLEAGDPERHVAVLSKIPFKEVHRHASVPITLFGKKDVVKRGVLEVVLRTTEGDVSIFVVHLKSRRTERKDDPEGGTQRLREAEAVRDLVLARFPDPAKAKFIVCGDWNDTRSSKPVRALAKRGDTEVGAILRGGDSRSETWTHFYRREDTYSRIDYIMVSEGLRRFVVGGRLSVYDGPGTSTASDHRPVSVNLKLDAVK